MRTKFYTCRIIFQDFTKLQFHKMAVNCEVHVLCTLKQCASTGKKTVKVLKHFNYGFFGNLRYCSHYPC